MSGSWRGCDPRGGLPGQGRIAVQKRPHRLGAHPVVGPLQVRTIFKEKLGFPAKEAQLFSDFFCFCGKLVLIQPLEDHGAHGPGGDPIG